MKKVVGKNYDASELFEAFEKLFEGGKDAKENVKLLSPIGSPNPLFEDGSGVNLKGKNNPFRKIYDKKTNPAIIKPVTLQECRAASKLKECVAVEVSQITDAKVAEPHPKLTFLLEIKFEEDEDKLRDRNCQEIRGKEKAKAGGKHFISSFTDLRHYTPILVSYRL